LSDIERRQSPPQRYMFHGVPLAVIGIAAICIVLELAIFAADIGIWSDSTLRTKVYILGAFWKQLLLGGQPVFLVQPVTMFGTYAFLHGGLIHMGVNMIALFSFGTAIVNRIGQKRFLVVYAISALGGAVGFGLFSESSAPMVGASGALFGLLGVWICWDYLDRRHHGDPLWVTLRALVFLVVYNLVFWLLLQGQLAWETHFGGFVAGWLLAVFWGRSVLDQSRRRRKLPNRVR
jgi:membrane associated rhomboid family serine protease